MTLPKEMRSWEGFVEVKKKERVGTRREEDREMEGWMCAARSESERG